MQRGKVEEGALGRRDAVQALESVGIFADQEDQRGGLGVLVPIFEGSFMMRSLRAKTAPEQLSFLRVSQISFESTLGRGAGSTL